MSENTPMIALIKAMIKAQGEMEPAKRSKENDHFKSKYATIDDIIEALRKPLANNGLAVVQTISTDETHKMFLHTTLWHEGGGSISSTMPLPNSIERPQSIGTAMSYYRRYCLVAITNMPSYDDDDANSYTKEVEEKLNKSNENIPNSGVPKNNVNKNNYMKGSPVESAPKLQVSFANKRSDKEKQELKNLVDRFPSYRESVYEYFNKANLNFDTISEATFKEISLDVAKLLHEQGSHAAA